MRAITYSRYGAPEVLRLREVEKPVPKDDEVLIRVRAAEATKSDCEMRSFRFAVNWFWLPLRLALGVRRPRRQVLGGYFSGEVVATGKEVTRFSAGDRVFGSARLRLGAYGEFVALPAGYTLGAMPGNMTFAEAAAVPLGGMNALHFMGRAKIEPGEKVLVNGAGGSIGAHAVQIAKAMGAEVTAVDRLHKRDFLLRLGADHFLDGEAEDCFAGGRRYHVIFDMLPKTPYPACLAALHPRGRYLAGNPRLSVMLRSVLTNLLTDKTVTVAFAPESNQDLSTLRAMVEEGKIRSIVDRVYAMEQAVEAHRRVETEERVGAVVIAIGGPP